MSKRHPDRCFGNCSSRNTRRAFWHKESYDRFLNELLPMLLAERLPLSHYKVEAIDTCNCDVEVGVAAASGVVQTRFHLPYPDEDGHFKLGTCLKLVVPKASSEHLDVAEIKCVGEQVYDFIESKLGKANDDLPWDEALLRAWLPLEEWLKELMWRKETEFALCDDWVGWPNWLALKIHLQRIYLPDRVEAITPSQLGRVCPYDTPEGPNIGKVLTIATGAEIRDGKVVRVDDSPEGSLGIAASMVPFIEHNDPVRQLMGVSGMRQWLYTDDPEPALVQTGNEVDAPKFWCGRNMLTAFISLGAMTYENAIVLSESAARRFDFPYPMEPGDKLSDRHGTKGIVGKILPDTQMPHLPDGTPVDLVYSFIGLHTRLNFGSVREALMGRIAHAEGAPAIVPPFHAPGDDEIRKRLRKCGLPESGMEALALNGSQLDQPSMVGYVYWGKPNHCSRDNIHASAGGVRVQLQGEMEYYQLRDIGAIENLFENYNTRSAERDDAENLVSRVEAGPVEQAAPPTPTFGKLADRLAAAGIKAEFDGEKVAFALATPEGNVLRFARPIPHPRLPGRELSEVGVVDSIPEYAPLAEAAAKLERIVSSGAPKSLVEPAVAEVAPRIAAYLTGLVDLRFNREPWLEPIGTKPGALTPRSKLMFSGRSVLAPSEGLSVDQVGLPDQIAWELFGPLVTREIGNKGAVEKRTKAAAEKLDEIMARSWVIVFRAPAFIPTAFIAFRPVRVPDKVIRIHPLVCFLMNADFDGDQAAVMLPITEAGQREAGEKLSFAGHLRRDPNLYGLRFLKHEALWGLARLSLTPEGLAEVSELASVNVAAPDGFVTRDTMAAAMRDVRERDGVEAMLAAMQRLMERGFKITRQSGASISPFIGESLREPADVEARIDALAAWSDFDNLDLGPQVLAVKSDARGTMERLVRLVGPVGNVKDVNERDVFVQHGYRDGLTPDELFACVAPMRRNLGQVHLDCDASAYNIRAAGRPKGFGVIARAMRSDNPGPVLARAAANGEVDPLTDIDARLFVGLRPR